MTRECAVFATVLLVCVATTTVAAEAERAPLRLITSQDAATRELAGWKAFSEESATKTRDVWKLGDDGVLVCRGTPRGYLATEKSFADFILRLEWRWPAEKPGKGGVLIRQTGADKIWPKSLEAQINAGEAGDFWGLDGYVFGGPAERLKVVEHPQFGKLTNLKRTAGVEKPAGEWNRYEIKAEGETVTLSINGQEVNRATGCETAAGKILLTAEGSEIHIRNLELIVNDR